jgi:hypothetical protein
VHLGLMQKGGELKGQWGSLVSVSQAGELNVLTVGC